MSERQNPPLSFSGLALEPDRFDLVKEAFAEIHKEIEALRMLDLQETHPAIVFRPVERSRE
jgi:hypothetical protein